MINEKISNIPKDIKGLIQTVQSSNLQIESNNHLTISIVNINNQKSI